MPYYIGDLKRDPSLENYARAASSSVPFSFKGSSEGSLEGPQGRLDVVGLTSI